jgi:hypothetical protein
LDEEKIPLEKFTAAYEAFERRPLSQEDVTLLEPTPMMTLRPSDNPANASAVPAAGRVPAVSRGITGLISPMITAPRNFRIQPEALKKSKNLRLLDDEDKSSNKFLQDMIAQLRKVQFDSSKNKMDKKRRELDDELMAIIKQLRKVDRAMMSSQQQNNQQVAALMANLRKTGILLDEQRLCDDADDNAGLEEALRHLQDNSESMDEFNKLLNTIQTMDDSKDTTAASHLTDVDKIYLERSLARLAKVLQTTREAQGVAKVMNRLPYVDFADISAEADSDAMIASLKDTVIVYPTRKVHEVTQVLLGLRRIDMNDDERKEYANRIASCMDTAKDKPVLDDLADIILRLKKVGLNPWEAKHVSGIFVDLRKTFVNAKAEKEEDGDDDDDDDDDDEERIFRLTRVDLAKLVTQEKMDGINLTVESFKPLMSQLSDQDMDDFSRAIKFLGKGEPSQEQANHRDYMQVLADAIRNLKKAKLNNWEAAKVSGILVNLRKTQYPDKGKDTAGRELVKLRKVTFPEKMNVIDDIVKKVKHVRWNLTDEVFEYFLDDVTGCGKGDPTEAQLHWEDEEFFEEEIVEEEIVEEEIVEDDDHTAGSVQDHDEIVQTTMVLKNLLPTKKSETNLASLPREDKAHDQDEYDEHTIDDECEVASETEYDEIELEDDYDEIEIDELKSSCHRDNDDGEDNADAASVDTMDFSTTSVSLGEEIVCLTDDEMDMDDETEHEVSQSAETPPHSPSQSEDYPSQSPTVELSERRVMLHRKPRFLHKNHHASVVGEKRWRFCENFATDEVIYSNLTEEQHERRLLIEKSLSGSMRDLGCHSEHSVSQDESHAQYVERKMKEISADCINVSEVKSSTKRGKLTLTPTPESSRPKLDVAAMDSAQKPQLPNLALLD